MAGTGKHSGIPDRPAAPVSVRRLVDWAERALTAAPLAYGHGTDNARDEAAWLVLAGLGLSPVDPDVDPDRLVDGAGAARAGRLVERRIAEARPAAYLTGRAWFAGLEFAVDERVLIPRSPLAEPIGNRFAPWLDHRTISRILDIGTGCGCIAIACAYAFPEARVDATDTDDAALAVAADNVARHGLGERVALLRADVYDGLPGGAYDLIVSNPPYVDRDAMAGLPTEYRHEPSHALAAGPEGLDVVERILAGAPDRLRPEGLLAVEMGRAADALERRHPRLGGTWLAFERGGEGVLLLTAAELNADRPA